MESPAPDTALQDLLRKLPAVDHLLNQPAIARLQDQLRGLDFSTTKATGQGFIGPQERVPEGELWSGGIEPASSFDKAREGVTSGLEQFRTSVGEIETQAAESARNIPSTLKCA